MRVPVTDQTATRTSSSTRQPWGNANEKVSMIEDFAATVPVLILLAVVLLVVVEMLSGFKSDNEVHRGKLNTYFLTPAPPASL